MSRKRERKREREREREREKERESIYAKYGEYISKVKVKLLIVDYSINFHPSLNLWLPN